MKKDKKPKRQPTGNYAVGFARPPESGKFTSARQPRRSSRAKVPAPQPVSDLDQHILTEASRKVGIRNGDKVETQEQYDAVVRALAVGGIKGSRLHADSFLDRADRAARRKEERRARNAKAYYEFQAAWQWYKEHMLQHGLKPKAWVPNAKDVYLTEDGEIEILGPSDHRERDMYREVRRIAKDIRKKMVRCREIANEDEENVQNLYDLLFWTEQLERFNGLLKGDYKIPLR